MVDTTAMLPGTEDPTAGRMRWFSTAACVSWSEDGERAEVFVGGTLIGMFSRKDRAARNALLMGLTADAKVHYGRLAAAFDITDETLRQMRRQCREEGLQAVVQRRGPGGSEKKLQGRDLRLAERGFARGDSLATVRATLARRDLTISLGTLSVERTRWRAQQATAAVSGAQDATGAAAAQSERGRDADLDAAPAAAPPAAPAPATSEPAPTPAPTPPEPAVVSAPPRSGRAVQHLGSWLLLASVAAVGLHEVLERERVRADRPGRRLRATTLRVAVDALIIALALGQRCIEGVRRLQTATAGVLLRASGAPSASWVRRVLGTLAGSGGAVTVALGMAGVHLRAARARHAAGPVVFYVDNHLRPYTGKHVVRRGWRMQDKRVLPGITDCYVHDEDGRAVFRIDAPAHESLTALMPKVTTVLRAAFGPTERILVACDRAGAYESHLAELREQGFDFVTYERRPYALVAATEFQQRLVFPDGEVVHWCEPQRKNLGAGRGRVRRIAVRDQQGYQINLLARSEEPAPWLIGVMRGRWKQENAFLHAVQRWGQNQLDARTVEPYPAETIIPNPARRRLDHALRLARVREGDARRQLARLDRDDPKRARAEADLAAALADQDELEAQRPHVPERQTLAQTELADALVYHVGDPKLVVDAVRVACANAEADLAALLAPYMKRPREAKKLLATVLAAPGHVTVGIDAVTMSLQCPGTPAERHAVAALLEAVTAARLSLPGDRRPLVFRSQESPE
jgi:hypothetical protein